MDAYLACMEARKIRDGIKLAMDVSREGNGFIQVSLDQTCVMWGIEIAFRVV